MKWCSRGRLQRFSPDCVRPWRARSSSVSMNFKQRWGEKLEGAVMPLQLQGNWSGLPSTVCSHKSMAMTKNESANPRVVSLDIRPRQLGYVVFEGATQLVDWGVMRFPLGSGHVDRSVKLLRTFQPCIEIGREIATGSRRDRPVVRDVIRSIQHEARRLSLPSVFIGRSAEHT